MQRNFLWINNMDDLAFKLLLLGLALVLALLIAFALFMLLWRRHRRRRGRASGKVHIQDEQKSKPLENCFTGPPEHFNTKADTFFIVPLNERANGYQNGTANGQQQQNGRKLSKGFEAFFQGSPPRTPKNQSLNKIAPLAPSPLNPVDYLDVDDGKAVTNGPKSVIRVEGENDKRNGKQSSRKDSIRPTAAVNALQFSTNGQLSKDEQKMNMKNRPFVITVNDDDDYDGQEAGKENKNDYKLAARESPLMMRRFTSTMEKVPESENERLYGEFETLNQQSMCTLRPRSSSAELPENMRKNRFYDILPFEFNRVKLRWANSAYGGTEGHHSDFINASYIQTEDGLLAYIAAQGPIGPDEAADGRRVNTIRDFWELVWQEQVNTVVMLTQTREGVKHKCAPYWPHSPGESEQLGPDFSVHLYCVTEDDICWQRELWLQRTGQPQRKVLQWHFKEWRDATGPAEVETLLTFIETVRASAKRRPILVHCSAGVGRTGVFIALDILLDKLAKEHLIDVKETVNRLRTQRTNMVQNAEQYVALYEAIALAIRKKSRTFG